MKHVHSHNFFSTIQFYKLYFLEFFYKLLDKIILKYLWNLLNCIISVVIQTSVFIMRTIYSCKLLFLKNLIYHDKIQKGSNSFSVKSA